MRDRSVPRLEEVHDPTAFQGVPARRFLARSTFAFVQLDTRALVTLAWGRPGEVDVQELTTLLELSAEARFAGHASLLDVRAVEALDLLAFEELVRFLGTRPPAWGAPVRRQAVLHRGGVVGAAIVGALRIAPLGYPLECFEDPEAAYAYLGLDDWRAELEGLRDALRGVPEVVRRLRGALETRGPVSGGELAQALAMSRRSLQRHLEGAGTTLRAERRRHVDAQVERLLRGTELDLDAIAARVGLCSASHLVRVFRASHGCTPGAWRASPTRATSPGSAAARVPRRRVGS